ncbi:MAG: hypothetical protein Q7U04_12935, partial [Bacteriovorax sp.]|nr:hypothetical protein [Bacteriovorax sp.]
MSERNRYELTKFLVNITTIKGDLNKNLAENIYLADMVTGGIFSSANSLSANIVSSTRNFYPVVFDILKSLPPESYINLGEILQAVGKSENDLRFKGVADFWSFFTPEEKNFVFNFVDRHFEKGTDYVLLFDFYTKFLDDFREVQPIFKDKWMGSEETKEMSYLTLQDMFSNLAGKETLLDFKKFFSRDQILKVLQIISNGNNINQLAKEELNYIKSDNYVIQSRSEKYKFKIHYSVGIDADYDSKAVIECMQKFTEIQNGLYQLIRNLPSACSQVTQTNIALKLYSWLNTIEENYLQYKKSTDAKDSLLDQNGIFSPYMINNSFGLAKIMDNLLGPIDSVLPTRNGINYLLTSTNFYLNQKAAAPLIDQNLKWANTLMNVNPERNILHRNALIKAFTRNENFSYSATVFNNLGKLFGNYGDWIKKGDFIKSQNRNLGSYDPSFDCEKVINQTIAPNPCPSKEVVKSFGNEILFLMQNTWEEEQGYPIAHLLKGFKNDEGLDIPLRGKVTRKYRISLSELFRFMYDSSDRTYKINNINVNFVNDAGKSSVENVTTLERIESVIREVRFGNNYLGVAFLNEIVHGSDYNDDVVSRKKILSKCVRIPVVRCSRKMSDNDLRMAFNSLEVFDALSDANNGRGLDNRLQYGDFLKTFETSLVASSAFAAQKTQLLPLSDELLVKHNGKILSDMTVMTALSNSARVIRDRVGRTRKSFDEFVNSSEFKRVDRSFLNGFDLPIASNSAKHLLRKLYTLPSTNEKQNLFSHTVDWLSSLSYNETRLVEDTIVRAIVFGSYLGSPEIVFNKNDNGILANKYANNNLFQIFLAVEKIVDYWPVLKNFYPTDTKLIDAIKPINTALYYLTNKLNSENDPQKNTAYLALNDLFLVLQTTLFDNLESPQIGPKLGTTTSGLNLILEMFKDPKLVSSTYSIIRDDYRYLDVFHQNNGEWFASVGQNLKRLSQSSVLDFTPIKDYLSFTTKDVVVLSGNTARKINYHYDEPADLLKYLNKKSDLGASNFMLMNQRLFIENFE